jgi:bifunctional non-homologous end joining protein LigD
VVAKHGSRPRKEQGELLSVTFSPLARYFGGLETRKGELRKGIYAFVVQKHRATALHYDFRLEIGGVMPSWSIPKGPTLDPTVKRLALPTAPHDLEYRHFEGFIPRGSYDAGAVMIWDEGTYTPEVEALKGIRRMAVDSVEAEEIAEAGFRDGNLKFVLYGSKLRGSFALIRTEGLGGGGKEAWLLIKHRDEYCRVGYDVNDYDFSAVSNRSLAQIAEAASRE